MTLDLKWYEIHDNLIGCAEWLDGMCEFSDSTQAIRFFEKPWKWTREFELWQLWIAADDADNVAMESDIEAALNDDTTADDIRARFEEAEQRDD